MRRLLVALALVASVGCATTDRGAGQALAEADARAAQGDYPAAMAAYDAYLARYPDGDGAARVRAVRGLVQELLALRRERDQLVAREAELTREVAQARQAAVARESAAREAASREGDAARQLVAREAELAKLRQEVAQRQAEAARLREDLEALKRTDLQMERRRR